jgi:hypothetical protein
MSDINIDNLQNFLGQQKSDSKNENQTSFTEKQIAEVDLYKIDYDYVDQLESKRELRLSLAALKKDGYFTDLMKHVEKRLKVLDSSYQTD